MAYSGGFAGEKRDVREAALAGQPLGHGAILVLPSEDRVALKRPERVRMGGASRTVAAGDLRQGGGHVLTPQQLEPRLPEQPLGITRRGQHEKEGGPRR